MSKQREVKVDLSDQRRDLGGYRRDNELSLTTRDERWDRVRRAMASEGIDILVTPPNPGMMDQLQANAAYLSTISGNGGPVSVVFPADGAVTVITGSTPSPSFWQAWQSWVTDVRTTRWALAEGVIACLRELDADGKRIGIPGLHGTPRAPEGLASTGFIERLSNAFPKMTISDATALLDTVRSRKTEEERAAVGEAVAITEEAYKLLLNEARPGVPERVIYGKMVGRLIECGSIPPNFLGWSVGANFDFSLAMFPTGRPLETGEPIYCEIEARSPSGYLGQITRTAFLGTPPVQLVEMADLCRETFMAVLGLMAPGVSMGDVLARYKETSAGSRYQVIPIIHARALGEDRPMIIFDTTDLAIIGFPIREDHVFALKVQVRDPESGLMVFLGESIAVGPTGAIRMSDQPLGLTVID